MHAAPPQYYTCHANEPEELDEAELLRKRLVELAGDDNEPDGPCDGPERGEQKEKIRQQGALFMPPRDEADC